MNDVMLENHESPGLALVIARNGAAPELNARVFGQWGLELPNGPKRVVAGEIAFAGVGPGKWLATREQAGNAFARSLAESLRTVASVSDQSDAYAVWRMSGAGVRDLLARLIPIDVHPHAFEVGDVAVTVAAHIGATVWRLDDAADGSPRFDIAVPSSMAQSFREQIDS